MAIKEMAEAKSNDNNEDTAQLLAEVCSFVVGRDEYTD